MPDKPKPKRKKKAPVDQVRTTVRVGVKFPAKDCSGNERLHKAELEDGIVKFYEPDSYGGWNELGKGVHQDVLEKLLEQLKAA